MNNFETTWGLHLNTWGQLGDFLGTLGTYGLRDFWWTTWRLLQGTLGHKFGTTWGLIGTIWGLFSYQLGNTWGCLGTTCIWAPHGNYLWTNFKLLDDYFGTT